MELLLYFMNYVQIFIVLLFGLLLQEKKIVLFPKTWAAHYNFLSEFSISMSFAGFSIAIILALSLLNIFVSLSISSISL